MGHDGLRELEHLVLLALARLDAPAHGVPIVRELQRTVGREISRASIYVVLRRLESRRLVTSSLGDPTPQRGGRAKRLYALTPQAVRLLKSARRDFVKLWAGSRVLGAVLITLCLSGALASAQTTPVTRPNFSGTWLSVSDPNATSAEVAATLPNALLIIGHDGDRFDLSRSWTREAIKEKHVCDGRENVNGYSTVVERTTCRWDAAALVIEGTIGAATGPPAGSLRQHYSIDKDGLLVVERVRKVTQIQGSGKPQTQRYRKLPTAGAGDVR